MTDIREFSDDIFIEEANRRANLGQWSPDRYMSQLQSDDRAKVGYLRSVIIKANVESIHSGECHPVLQSLASLCDELDSIEGNPMRPPAHAVNTTLPGREDNYETHQEELRR